MCWHSIIFLDNGNCLLIGFPVPSFPLPSSPLTSLLSELHSEITATCLFTFTSRLLILPKEKIPDSFTWTSDTHFLLAVNLSLLGSPALRWPSMAIPPCLHLSLTLFLPSPCAGGERNPCTRGGLIRIARLSITLPSATLRHLNHFLFSLLWHFIPQ